MLGRLRLYSIRQAGRVLRIFMPDDRRFEMSAKDASCFGGSGVVARVRQADRQPGSATVDGMVDRRRRVGDLCAVIFVILEGL